eukprot:Skav200696  [mRNA]  locus=scaffold343:164621:171937:- [translate_table: standard]
MQRLIVDARDANAKQQRPPCTSLSTPAGFMDLDFADFVDGVGEVMEMPAFSMAAGDVGDCFYNFSVAPLAAYFCTDDRASVSHLRKLGFPVNFIYDDLTGSMVQPSEDEQLWFAFGGMAMGWSWALFLANEAIVHQSQLGSGLGKDRFLRDKLPCPDVKSGPVVGVYVDNINVVGACGNQVAETMDSIAQQFSRLGIPFEVTDPAGQAEVESLGLQFSFGSKVTLRNKSSRAWRLYLATKAILKRKRVSGELLRVWLGHTNFFFQRNRLGLSCLSAVYKFSALNLGRRAPMWPNAERAADEKIREKDRCWQLPRSLFRAPDQEQELETLEFW